MLSAGQSVQKYIFYATVGPEPVYTPQTTFQCAPLVAGDNSREMYIVHWKKIDTKQKHVSPRSS